MSIRPGSRVTSPRSMTVVSSGTRAWADLNDAVALDQQVARYEFARLDVEHAGASHLNVRRAFEDRAIVCSLRTGKLSL
jgi:hypothetical protein